MGLNFNANSFKRISLMFLMLTLFTGASAYAQKARKTKAQSVQAPITQYVFLQDDLGEGFLVFNVTDGAYKAKLCDYGYSFSGFGSVKVDGCSITFAALETGYAITATANVCDQKGQSFIQVKQVPGASFDIQPIEETLNDSNISDSTTDCAVKETPPAPVPTEIIVQSDTDGSFLNLSTAGDYKFINCENGVAISGSGKVTISGDMLYFEHITNEYRVLASINLTAKEGKAAIEVFTPFKQGLGEVPAMRVYISDNTLADNTAQCGAKK